jgi:Xaa-Pro aminopeptidase
MAQGTEASEFSVPAQEINTRIRKLQESLEVKQCGAALLLQKTDIYYYSGTSQQAWLYVPAAGTPLLLVFKDYQRARRESPLEEIREIGGPKQIPEILSEGGYSLPKMLGMELDVLPANLYFYYAKIFAGVDLVDIATEIRLQRAVKSAYEVARMRAAARLADEVASFAATRIAIGKQEVVLAGEIEAFARAHGHQGLVRMRMFNNELHYGHILSGSGAAVPSYLASPTGGQGVSTVIGQGAGYREIKANEPVLIDYVFALDGYLADHARIFSIGRLDSRLEKAHEEMLELQAWVKQRAVPGMPTGQLYEEMVARAEEKGYGDAFMGASDKRIRFTGHGVGLELDEYPLIAKGQKVELAAGMVFALEPKTIFPGAGIAGIENTHLVTGEGLEALTTYPDAIQVLSRNQSLS